MTGNHRSDVVQVYRRAESLVVVLKVEPNEHVDPPVGQESCRHAGGRTKTAIVGLGRPEVGSFTSYQSLDLLHHVDGERKQRVGILLSRGQLCLGLC